MHAPGLTTGPGSHCSPATTLTMPSPHADRVQLPLQCAVWTPSSHCSLRARSILLSPQKATVQSRLQLPDSVGQSLPHDAVSARSGPGSHSSPLSTVPLPHFSSDLQSAEQPSPDAVLPSSQTSPLMVSTMPLPQVSFDLQSAEQPSPETLLPSSQTSPLQVSTMPLPQVSSDLQSAEQPPQLVLSAPLSQTSPFDLSTMPLPQLSFDVQSAEQPSPSTMLPSSQTSPAAVSMRPLPHRVLMQTSWLAAHVVPAGQTRPFLHCTLVGWKQPP